MINKKNIIRLLKLISSYKKELFITLVSTIIISLIGIIDSLLLSYLIDNVLYSNAKFTLFTIAIIMILISIFQIALKGYKNILIQKISYVMDINLMIEFYIKILHIKYCFFEKHKTGELLSRLNDTRIVRNALSEGLIAVVTNVLMFIIVGSALFYINGLLFFILFISVIILGFIVIHFGNFFSKSYPISMEKDASLQAFITESFSGIETIKTFPSIAAFTNQYEEKQFDKMKINWNITEKCIIQNSVSSITDKIVSVLILILGALFVMNDEMTLGQIASFISLSGFFTSSILTLLDLQAGIQEAFAACNRLFEILDEESDNLENGLKINNQKIKINFNNVDFTYSNETELYKNFNIEINSGEWISFVGKTGCGKTTLARLMATKVNALFVELSAVSSGIKEIKETVEKETYIDLQKALSTEFLDKELTFEGLIGIKTDSELSGETYKNYHWTSISPVNFEVSYTDSEGLVDNDVSNFIVPSYLTSDNDFDISAESAILSIQ